MIFVTIPLDLYGCIRDMDKNIKTFFILFSQDVVKEFLLIFLNNLYKNNFGLIDWKISGLCIFDCVKQNY